MMADPISPCHGRRGGSFKGAPGGGKNSNSLAVMAGPGIHRRHSLRTHKTGPAAGQNGDSREECPVRRCSSVRVSSAGYNNRTGKKKVTKENSLPVGAIPGRRNSTRNNCQETPEISISSNLDPLPNSFLQCNPFPRPVVSSCRNIPCLSMPEDDQFAQYLYQSHHIATPRSSPPELVLEVPSDSDSSRRPSHASYAPSEYSQFSISPSPSCFISPSPSCGLPQLTEELPLPPGRRRRASHGEMSSSPSERSPSPRIMPGLLGVPTARTRGASLPGSIDAEELYRLRNFSVKGKKVVNRGDSFKSRSRTSINSRRSSFDQLSGEESPSDQLSHRSGKSSLVSSRRTSRANSRSPEPHSGLTSLVSPRSSPRSRKSSIPRDCGEDVEIVRVLMLGSSHVGKSSLCAQFLSSEHINAYDKVEDSVCKEVSVSVNDAETRIIFVDHQHGEMSVENQLTTYSPDAFLVVLAVDDILSLDQADRILGYLKMSGKLAKDGGPCILVANKTDMVRNRVVKSSAGRAVAQKYNIKYIETSPGINHNVDELLVGILTQLKLRKNRSKNSHKTNKVLDFFGRVLSLQTDKNKSCSNLNIL